MLFKAFNLIKSFLFVSVASKYKDEFELSISRINIARGKTTATTLIVLEAIMLVVSLLIKKKALFTPPNIYYLVMYILMIITMAIYLLVFTMLGKNVSKYRTSTMVAVVSFTAFLLSWCAGISLLDQLSFGQIFVYAVAIIAVAVTPYYEPITLLCIYITVHILFLALMVYFQKSGRILFGDYVNSTSFLIISWAISQMRYKSQIEHFNNRRIIQEKSDELIKVNLELEEANQKLEKLSQTDSLTGIFNRSVFDRVIKIEWDRCKRHDLPLSLIMIDIDFFKAFNDNYGHQAGDDCLKQVAEVLSNCARRSSDIVARYGGEEFAIILPHMEKENVLKYAERLRKKVEQLTIPHRYSSISEHLTISLGVHTDIPSNATSIEKFIKTADKALYEAKKGRNNIVVA